jgi:hypothetical protein
MDRTAAAVVGFSAALALPALVLGVWTAIGLGEGQHPGALIVWPPLIYLGSGPVAGIFAVPAFVLGQRLGLIRWWSSITIGLVIGAAAFLMIGGYPTPSEYRGMIVYPLLGGASGLIFWIVYERLRPHLASPSC